MRCAMGDERMSADTPIFAIAVAAELAGMHPQTLRQYDRRAQRERAPQSVERPAALRCCGTRHGLSSRSGGGSSS